VLIQDAAGPRGGARRTIQKVEARKQEIAEAGAGATGIEPKTAIQRDCSVTRHPPKPPLRLF
jgi:metal-dependent amidase/aminoacylase/carboxypeptidase family protein